MTNAVIVDVVRMASGKGKPGGALSGTHPVELLAHVLRSIVERNGIVQPAPAPRYSRTPGGIQRPPSFPGQHTDEAMADWGITADRIAALRSSGAIA